MWQIWTLEVEPWKRRKLVKQCQVFRLCKRVLIFFWTVIFKYFQGWQKIKKSWEKTVSFSIAPLPQNSATLNDAVGLLIDDGTVYTAFGIAVLRLFEKLYGDIDTEIDPILASLKGVDHWQFGVGEHASESRCIFAFVVLYAKFGSWRHVRIQHLLAKASSHWLIGKSVISKADLLHVGMNAIKISCNGEADFSRWWYVIDWDLFSWAPSFFRSMCMCQLYRVWKEAL